MFIGNKCLSKLISESSSSVQAAALPCADVNCEDVNSIIMLWVWDLVVVLLRINVIMPSLLCPVLV